MRLSFVRGCGRRVAKAARARFDSLSVCRFSALGKGRRNEARRARPANIAKLIGDLLLNVVRSSGGKKGFGILIALAVAIWGGRNAAGSVIIALNIAYEEEEKRGFAARTLLALAMTLGAVALALAGVAAMAALSYFAHFLPHSSRAVRLIGRLITYPVLLLGAADGAATVYRYGPSPSAPNGRGSRQARCSRRSAGCFSRWGSVSM